MDCAGQTTGIGLQHCATNVLERILCNTELLYIGLRHSATKKQRLFVLFLKYSAFLRSSFWGRVFFPRWLHLKHVCCEYQFQDPGDRQQQSGTEGLQHDGGDDDDGNDGGAEGHQHDGDDEDDGDDGGAEEHQHGGDDGGDGDGDGGDGGAEEHQHGSDDDDCAVRS